MRRSTFTDHAVTYGAIGGTLAPDLLTFPPTGYRVSENAIRLGSGDDRFEAATHALLTWGIPLNSGIRLDDISPGTGEQYQGIVYGPDGTPLEKQPDARPEARFTEDGTPWIAPGMTAVQKLSVGPFEFDAPMRIVFVIEEPDRVGYGIGTLPGHPLSGEECFIVDRHDDGSVWLTIRQFSRPATTRYRLVWPLIRRIQKKFVARYLRALHPTTVAG
ncbi:DUF1990 domain-containing protein [Agromyces atrinae]|uniref:DUF1990 family protein n=1 Tax=Agromyces atrinae TaxID=592376 RepID=UPI001F5912EE|nr:DUF1990 domain-containing protein [Agromyces atrinae]MCI2958785.1 DUF1990 domain-containing protein [Agromyces atrinae]